MRPTRRATGFTLIEILIVVIILGILAAIVIPDFASVMLQSREATLRNDLRYVRTQLSAFNAQFGQPPATDHSNDTFVQQMTLYLDSSLSTSSTQDSTHRFGPYLAKMPYNPTNNKNTIKFVTSGELVTATDASYGWIYCPETLDFYAANGIYSPAQEKW